MARRKKRSKTETETFWDHLEVLRWKFVATAACIGAIAAVFFIFGDKILAELLTYPRQMGVELVYIRPQEKFLTYLRMVLLSAVICGIPVAVLQTASFIFPGLHGKERRIFVPVAAVMILLYTGGVLFGYFLLVPYVIGFFLRFGSPEVLPFWSIGAYIQVQLSLILMCGLIFFLPLALFSAVKMGIFDVGMLRAGRKYVLLGLFIAAAFLTPPDMFTQIAVGGVLYLLYEITIIALKVTMPKKSEKSENKEKSDEQA